MITLTLKPIDHGARWEVWRGDERIYRGKVPLFGAARALKAEGVSCCECMELVREGKGHADMRANIWWAAGQTVEDNAHFLRRKKHVEYGG